MHFEISFAAASADTLAQVQVQLQIKKVGMEGWHDTWDTWSSNTECELVSYNTPCAQPFLLNSLDTPDTHPSSHSVQKFYS